MRLTIFTLMEVLKVWVSIMKQEIKVSMVVELLCINAVIWHPLGVDVGNDKCSSADNDELTYLRDSSHL